MKWRDIGLLALKNTLRAKQKALLCSLAVCVGVASVYILCEISRNAQGKITEEIEKSGMGGIMVFADDSELSGMKVEEIRQLPKQVPQLAAAMPIFSQYGNYQLRNRKGSMMLWGVDEQFSQIFQVQLKHGRLPTRQDLRRCARVAVVEDTMAQKAYGRENVVGKSISIYLDNRREDYEIIGVIRSQKSGINNLIGGDKLPGFVYVPYTTANLYSQQKTTGQLAMTCAPKADTQAVTAMALDQLSRQKDGAKFRAENISGYVDTFSSILSTVSILMTLIGGISLVVGGIGVMNSMIASIESRKKEIGIYLAIGAQKRDIIGCYLLEGVLICLMGGIAGGVLGAGLLLGGSQVVGIPIQLHWQYLLLAEGAAVACGLVFGLLPARRAAAMSPISAIRSE